MISLALAFLLAAATPDERRAAVAECLGTRDFAMDLDRVWAARETAGPAAWREACRQARDAETRRKALIRALLASGSSPLGGYPAAAGHLRNAEAATDPDMAQLFRHAARDQAARESLLQRQKALFAAGLSPLAQTLLDGLIAHDAVRADAASRAWLAGAVARRGWFTRSRDGEAADQAAWLIVQHADADRTFQRAMLDVLEPLAETGETSPQRFALLYDRWAAGTGKPQRYGLQGRCTGPGEWEPLPLERPQEVDNLRRKAGLESTLETFRAERAKACR